MFHIFRNSANLLKKQQQDILSAAFIIGASVAVSRVLGLVRYRLLASYFGNNLKLLDSFIAASILPDAIFEVLIFGTIALAFIPIFSKYLTHDKLEKAWKLSNTMITIGLMAFVVFSILIILLAQFIAPLLAPGLVASFPETKLIITRLLQIMIFAQLFFVISIFLTGILQSFQRFLIPAIASIFYNVGIIISIIFLSGVFGIYAPALGMILGALLHLLIQLPMVMSMGYKFKLSFDFKNSDVREMFTLMWPRSVTLGLTRLSEMVNIALASIVTIGSIVAFNFAQVLQLVPTAFFAASISQAALPPLSVQFNENKMAEFKKTFIESFHQVLFLVLPASAFLAILRIPAVRLVFGAREFPWDVTVLTGRTLIAFAVGIAAQSLNLLLIRAFHAARDSYTPVKVTAVTTIINIFLSFSFVFYLHLSILWLALAFSFANILQALALYYFLNRKLGGFEFKLVAVPVIKMLFITAAMAISLYIPMKLLDQLVFDTTHTIGLILLTAIAAFSGGVVYLALSYFMQVEQVFIFTNFAKRLLSIPAKLLTPPTDTLEAQHPNP